MKEIENAIQEIVAKVLTLKIADAKEPLPIKIQDPVYPERVIRFRASDDTCDDMGDVVLADGWRFQRRFMSNPAIMAFHDYSAWPIGKGVGVGVIGNALYIDAEFDPPEVDESADLIFRKIKHGSVKACSVGFQGVRWIIAGRDKSNMKQSDVDLMNKYPMAKRIFIEQELIEFTVCALGMNPSAQTAALMKRLEKCGTEIHSAGAVSDSISPDEMSRYAAGRLTRLAGRISR
jgi:hypothetical protein